MDEAQEIKDKIDVVDLVGSYVNLKKSGINYKGLCPFHSEKTPSFMVNPERQIFKCFGCSQGGDVFEFIMKMENLTFRETLVLLADKAGITLTNNQTSRYNNQTNTKHQDTITKQYQGTDLPDTKSRLYQINGLVAGYYHKLLTTHPAGKKALDYLKSRGLNDKTIATFKIGYAPNQPILDQLLRRKGFNPGEITAAGSPGRFKNRVIFPLFDIMGNVIGFTGRALDPSIQPKYLNTPETKIFYKSRVLYGLAQGRKAVKEKAVAVLLEGQMDVVSAFQTGVTNVLASSGTALTPDHLKIISRYTQNIILSFDMDEAGQKATLSAIENAGQLGLNIKVAILPEPYKDAGEAIAKDPKIFTDALLGAKIWFDFLLDYTLTKQKVNHVSPANLPIIEKKEIAKTILPFIAALADPIEKDHFLNQLAQKIAVPLESIKSALKTVVEKNRPQKKEEITAYKSNPRLTPDQTLLGLFKLYPQFQKEHPWLYNQLEEEYSGDTKELELQVEQIYQSAGLDVVKAEIEQMAGRKVLTSKEAQKTEFARLIAQAEKEGNRDKIKNLLKKLQEELSD